MLEETPGYAECENVFLTLENDGIAFEQYRHNVLLVGQSNKDFLDVCLRRNIRSNAFSKSEAVKFKRMFGPEEVVNHLVNVWGIGE